MASTRFKGEYDSDILNVSGVKSRDMIQARHGVKIISEDSDKAIPFEVLQARPVAVCTSAAATGTKTATLTDSFPDFTLINGREIIVYMANANTAAEPSLLITGTEAIPLECNSWNAGTFLRCKYVDITINGTRVRKWLVDTGYANTTSQLNGALTNALTSVLKKQTLSFSYNIPASGDTIFTFNHPNNYQLLQMLVSDVSLPDAGIIGNPIKNGNTYTVRMLNAGSLAFHGILSVELIWCPTSYLSPL